MKQFRIFLISIQLLIAVFLLSNTIFGQTTDLQLNQPLERQIKGGETQNFQINLKAGQYAHVEVIQKTINVTVSVFAPDGKLIIEMDGKNGSFWRRTSSPSYNFVSCIAEKDGIYRVEIKGFKRVEDSGSYSVKLAENRQATVNDQKRIEAETHLFSARKFIQQGGIETVKAVKEYETAIVLWHELNDVVAEAVTLNNLGLVQYAYFAPS